MATKSPTKPATTKAQKPAEEVVKAPKPAAKAAKAPKSTEAASKSPAKKPATRPVKGPAVKAAPVPAIPAQVRPAEPAPAAQPAASPLARWVYEQRVAEAKYAVTRPVERLREDEGLGELPGSYGANLMTLLPLNPTRAYVYWDLDYARLGEHWQGLADARPVVRLFRLVGDAFQPEGELQVDLGTHNHYLPVEAGGTYAAELGLRGANGYRAVLSSNVLTVPTDRVSDQVEASFVSVPLDAPLPAGGLRPAAAGIPTLAGRMLTRTEYEQLFGKGVPGIPGSQHR